MTDRCENCIHVQMCKWTDEMVANHTCDWYEEDRPHGEWEHWGSPFSDDSIANSIVCSLCKARYVEIDGEVFNFCPNCGTPMKKEGEAE